MSKATEKVKVAMVGAGGMANGVHYPSLAEIILAQSLLAGR